MCAPMKITPTLQGTSVRMEWMRLLPRGLQTRSACFVLAVIRKPSADPGCRRRARVYNWRLCQIFSIAAVVRVSSLHSCAAFAALEPQRSACRPPPAARRPPPATPPAGACPSASPALPKGKPRLAKRALAPLCPAISSHCTACFSSPLPPSPAITLSCNFLFA